MELTSLYKTDAIKNKANIFLVFIFFLFFILVLRLWYLQVIRGDEMRNLAENNRIRIKSIANYRGNILDRTGKVLVSIKPSFNLYVTREDTKNLESALELLKPSVDLSQAPTMEKIKAYPSYREFLLRKQLSKREVAFLEENSIDFPGFTIKVEPTRDYKFGDLASQVLGYLGEISERQMSSAKAKTYELGDLIGQYGLERKFESFLRGKKGTKRVEIDAAGRELSVLEKVDPAPGYNLVLSLDLNLQKIVEKEMEGKRGSIVVLNPRNGNILAIVSKPSFDPNLFAMGISHSDWNDLIKNENHPMENRAIKGLYPPGSIYKIVLASAGLEEGIISENTTYHCPGYFVFGRRRYGCWNKHGHGKLNLNEALLQSCDVYFYRVGHTLGIDTMARYAKKFGLGSITGFDKKNEKAGLVPTKAWKKKAKKEPWQPGETISASIGQSYNLVTPLQLAHLISAVGNGGTLYKPSIVKSIRKYNGDVVEEFKPQMVGRLPVKKRTLQIIRRGLLEAVRERRGTGWRAQVKGVQVAGKTGTVQVVSLRKEWENIPEEDIPLKFRDHALFVAFAPFENPYLAISIVVEHGGHGGSAAAPIAKKIVQAFQ